MFSLSVMEKLPPTSYVRMVDIWLIFGQLIPFIEVALLTIMELFNETETINHHGHPRPVQVLQIINIFVVFLNISHRRIRNHQKQRNFWLSRLIGQTKQKYPWLRQLVNPFRFRKFLKCVCFRKENCPCPCLGVCNHLLDRWTSLLL